MVPRTRNHAQLQGLHKIHRHLVCRMHSRRDAQQSTDFPGQALLGSVEPHLGCFGFAVTGGLGLHSEREGAKLLAVAAVQAESPMEQALPAGRSEGA